MEVRVDGRVMDLRAEQCMKSSLREVRAVQEERSMEVKLRRLMKE
jgi:hypothetical protein